MDIVKQIAAAKIIDATLLGRELVTATGIACTVKAHEPGLDANGLPDENAARLVLFFDSQPVDADVDAAIAAHPSMSAGMGDQFIAVANAPTLVRPIMVEPGEHVGLRITLAVSMAGATASDGLVEALVPVWRNANGTVDFERPKAASSSRIIGPALDVSVQQLNGSEVGVAISYSQRASGTVHVLYLDVSELYRKTIP